MTLATLQGLLKPIRQISAKFLNRRVTPYHCHHLVLLTTELFISIVNEKLKSEKSLAILPKIGFCEYQGQNYGAFRFGWKNQW